MMITIKVFFYFSQDKYIKKFRFKFFEFLTMIEEPGKLIRSVKSRISDRIAAHHIQQIEKYCVEKTITSMRFINVRLNMERNNEYETFHHRMVNAFESFLSLPPACPISFTLIQFSVSIYALNVYSSIAISINFCQKKLESCIIKNQSSIMFHFSKMFCLQSRSQRSPEGRIYSSTRTAR